MARSCYHPKWYMKHNDDNLGGGSKRSHLNSHQNKVWMHYVLLIMTRQEFNGRERTQQQIVVNLHLYIRPCQQISHMIIQNHVLPVDDNIRRVEFEIRDVMGDIWVSC
jgi:hypothetical protein